jgi:mannose/fructose/N-acetylgalactosamine-specific phosphotransferase system component IIC
MNSHDITIAGYLVVLGAAVLLQVLATRTRAPVPSLGQMLTRAMRTRTGRVGLLVAWAWIGLHFFAH